MPLTILLLAANPDDTDRLMLYEEARSMDAVLCRGGTPTRSVETSLTATRSLPPSSSHRVRPVGLI
jgi:hypothetical protein